MMDVLAADMTMNIGIVGAGQMARILGTAWGVNNHLVCFGADNVTEASALAERSPHATAGTYADAADFGDIVLLALPWRDALDTASALRERLTGKTLIDCTNPMDEAGEFQTFDGISLAEQLARRLPETTVVKALNAISPEVLRYVLSKGRPFVNGQPLTAFYCGDGAQAKLIAAGLIGELNLEPVDVGDLREARLLEPIGVLAERLRKSGTLGDAVAINAVHEARDHSFIDRFM
jgi:predicted dinucleotide-binding enzyme